MFGSLFSLQRRSSKSSTFGSIKIIDIDADIAKSKHSSHPKNYHDSPLGNSQTKTRTPITARYQAPQNTIASARYTSSDPAITADPGANSSLAFCTKHGKSTRNLCCSKSEHPRCHAMAGLHGLRGTINLMIHFSVIGVEACKLPFPYTRL